MCCTSCTHHGVLVCYHHCAPFDHALGMEFITHTCQPLGCLVCVGGGCGVDGCALVYVSGGYTCCVGVVECE